VADTAESGPAWLTGVLRRSGLIAEQRVVAVEARANPRSTPPSPTWPSDTTGPDRAAPTGSS
jgi:hypothetical protein